MIYGTRLLIRELGRVADFCPVCHRPTTCRVRDICTVGHICFVAWGEPQSQQWITICESCGSTIWPPRLGYTSFCRDKKAGLEDLVASTHPTLFVAYRDRLEIEERARTGKLTSKERADLLLEPFLQGMHTVELRKTLRLGQLHRWAMLLGLLVVVGIFVVLIFRPPPDTSTDDVPILLLVVAAAAVGLGYQLIHEIRMVTCGTDVMLIRSLAPLAPTQSELENVLLSLARDRSDPGVVKKAALLYWWIDRERARHL